MAFCKTIIHVVQPADTFYRLAQRYQTTVPDIIMRNPGINPYNLQTGTRLNICVAQNNTNNVQQDEVDLSNDMRQAWTQYAFWNMIYMNSLYHSLDDLVDVQARLMQTPEDIASVFDKFYSQSMVNQLTQLLAEHIQIGGELMAAVRDNNNQLADQLDSRWNQNAEKIARLLSSANSVYNYDEILKMLLRHLDMLKRQMMAALSGEYGEEIRLFDENENQLMELADVLTEGLLEQFYQQ